MFSTTVLTSILVAALSYGVNCEASVLPRRVKRVSTPFDGQYIQPSTANNATEWWYAQVVAEPVGNNPPANLQALFYQGNPIAVGARDSSEPEYYITINGMFPNGTIFNFNLPASSGIVTANGQAISGTWSDVGSFSVSSDLSSFTAHFTASDLGFSGSLEFTSRSQHHFGCNSTVDPYFDSAIGSGQQMNSPEELLFEQLGWATTIPGGNASVNLEINGTSLQFTGNAYHDANWLTQPINSAVNSWYFLNAAVGPFDMSSVLVSPINSTRQLSTGFLSQSGVILQNQCSVVGTKTADISSATPFGLYHDIYSGVDLPTGFTLNYTLANGDEYTFALTSMAQNPDQIVYHRWIGTAKGGKVGGPQYKGTTVFEWLNPGLNVYTESQ